LGSMPIRNIDIGAALYYKIRIYLSVIDMDRETKFNIVRYSIIIITSLMLLAYHFYMNGSNI